ncbi:MAG TPA: bifunctional 3'-5' exonuclease/DNA polymerase [Propionibacteriaceae bacterium]|nr:bifunctional 3'-5' exonuclease/DNA polymerase [Propionibacteriaceae bacterium]
MDVVLAQVEESVHLAELTEEQDTRAVSTLTWPDVPAAVATLEKSRPRWVWVDTGQVYPRLLAAGVRVQRCCDLRLRHAILARSRRVDWHVTDDDARWARMDPPESDQWPSLLDHPNRPTDASLEEVLSEYRRQGRAVHAAREPERIQLLLAAESAGALVAAEMRHTGLPWSAEVHDAKLTEILGPRPLPGARPARLEELVHAVRAELNQPSLNPDSQPELLRALRGAGIDVKGTRQSELSLIRHPVIAPLLAYKKLSRLLTANGWSWLSAWVSAARFHPDYVPSGVVTGRWATRGGGALQLPKQIRSAVVADPGHRLVVADAAQLEPRILAAMSGDQRMSRASCRGDLYQALVDEDVGDTRAHAKVAMLGALYGATSGEGGQLMPRLLRAYPEAIGLVEQAAREGERGGVVTTWLGRSSPAPPLSWHAAQGRASQPDAGAAEQRMARQRARDWGRFTRNFVVQGTAAEWALCWLATLRGLLSRRPPDPRLAASPTRGRAELVYFLHDEVIVHTPADLSDAVSDAVRESARTAGRLMFGRFPVEFALDVTCVDDYGQAE